MELNQLRGFMTIAQAGSFTKAAEALFLTQPALSLQIKNLEAELNEKLFERHGKQLLLTDAGRVLLERAEQILELLDLTRQEVEALHGLHGGRLTIGANDSFCLYLLPKLIQFFQERFPKIELRFNNRHSADVVKLVANGEVDFGLVTMPVLDARVTVEPLFWREDVAICHPTHPLTEMGDIRLEDLIAYPFLTLETGSTSRALLDHMLAKSGFAASIREMGNVEVIKSFVAINLGVAIVPGFTIEEELKTGQLYAIRLPWLSARSVGIVQRRKGYLSPAGQMFIKLLKNHIPDVLLCPL